jgi:hypothetical protein
MTATLLGPATDPRYTVIAGCVDWLRPVVFKVGRMDSV